MENKGGEAASWFIGQCQGLWVPQAAVLAKPEGQQ